MASGIISHRPRLVKCACGGFYTPKIEIKRDGRRLKSGMLEKRSARSRFVCWTCKAVRHTARVYDAPVSLPLSHPAVEVIRSFAPLRYTVYVDTCLVGIAHSPLEAEHLAATGLAEYEAEQARIAVDNAAYALAMAELQAEELAREDARRLLERVTPPVYVCASRLIKECAYGERLADSWVQPEYWSAMAAYRTAQHTALMDEGCTCEQCLPRPTVGVLDDDTDDLEW